MKYIVIALLVVTSIFMGCQKDSGVAVNINTTDLNAINNQLKGVWVYPIVPQNIVETASGAVDWQLYGTSPAFQFDGGSHVSIIKNTDTTYKGTYSLSTKSGVVYIDIVYPGGKDVQYKLLATDGNTLRVENSAPYVGSDGGTTTVQRQLVSDITLQKQTAADISGKLVRVVVISNKVYYNVSVAVVHTRLPKPADSTIVLNTKLNTLGTYTYEFAGQSGDQLHVDVLGDNTKTFFYAFSGGIPLAGAVTSDFQEIKTTSGWFVP